MFTIQAEATAELEVKKSRFIAIVKRVDQKSEVEEALSFYKQKYTGAKHYAYAYIIDGVKKCSDDKEPSKTAGAPILHLLEKKELNHVLCIVVRYFGGILLGAPGLVRAYAGSAKEAIMQAKLHPFIEYETYQITFPYSLVKKIDAMFDDARILKKEFGEMITYELQVEKGSPLLSSLQELPITIQKE